MINYRQIDCIIGKSWGDYQKNCTFNSETKEFIERFINEHYERVHQGLLDYKTHNSEKERMYRELLDLIKDDKSKLREHICNCISNLNRENMYDQSENIYINDVFKLQGCNSITW